MTHVETNSIFRLKTRVTHVEAKNLLKLIKRVTHVEVKVGNVDQTNPLFSSDGRGPYLNPATIST